MAIEKVGAFEIFAATRPQMLLERTSTTIDPSVRRTRMDGSSEFLELYSTNLPKFCLDVI